MAEEATSLPPISELDAHSLTTNGWAAWKIIIPEGGGLLDWRFEGSAQDAQQLHWAHWLFDGETWWSNLNARLEWNMQQVRLPPPVGMEVSERTGSDFEIWGFAKVYRALLSPGEYQLVMMGASDSDFEGSFLLSGSEGVTIASKTNGEEAFAFAEDKFVGPYKVIKRVPGEPHRVLIHDASLELEIEHSFFGIFQTLWTTRTQPIVVAWSGPEALGGLGIGSVHWSENFGPSPPGLYRFTIVHADQDQALDGVNPPYILVYGADVVLPT